MQLSGAQIVIKNLLTHGVTTVFGYPGGAVLPLYDELYKNSDKINHVLTAHEQGAAHAADGYARAGGKTGVVIATSGPGATNLVTGIANAYMDSIPMVVITGNVTVPLLGRDSFQEVDIVGITQPIVKHSYLARNVADLERILNDAFFIAQDKRPGPVLVDIPKNVQTDMCEYAGTPPIPQVKHGCDADVYAMAEMIGKYKRPYIYAGGGIIAAGAESELVALSRRLSAPVGLSMMGLTAIPYSYPLNLGMSGMHGRYAASIAKSECDLLIALGVRFSDRATGNVDEYGNGKYIIHVDIDKAEIGKNVPSQMEICGGVKETLQRLLEILPPVRNHEWLEHIMELKDAEPPCDNEVFTPRNIIKTACRLCGGDTIVATDVGQHQMWVTQFYEFSKTRTLLTSGGLGAMGYGLGAAIGAGMTANAERVILFTGDGSFGMNLTELATAVSQNLPIIIVILNNGVLGLPRQWQSMFFGERYSQVRLNRKTDFPALAKAFGAEGYAADSIPQLTEIIKNLPAKTPAVIDCRISEEENVLPMIPPGGSIKDIIR